MHTNTHITHTSAPHTHQRRIGSEFEEEGEGDTEGWRDGERGRASEGVCGVGKPRGLVSSIEV